jgi:hypothetical protein
METGTYTVVNPRTGGYRTIRLSDDTSWMSTPPEVGTLIASGLIGPDNSTSFTGIGFVRPDGTLSVWKSKAHMTDFVAATRWLLKNGTGREIELGKAYAVRSGRCYLCTKKLTTPASVHYGYGPECAKHHGLEYDAKAGTTPTNAPQSKSSALTSHAPDSQPTVTRQAPPVDDAQRRTRDESYTYVCVSRSCKKYGQQFLVQAHEVTGRPVTCQACGDLAELTDLPEKDCLPPKDRLVGWQKVTVARYPSLN